MAQWRALRRAACAQRQIWALAFLLLDLTGRVTADRDDSGIVVAPIQARARRPMPEHKIRMLREHWGNTNVGRRRGLDASKGRVPLHAGYGTHYSFLYVGTPPQRVSVILDTGSHWTAFPCTGCRQCGDHHTDPNFDVSKSSTYHELSCSECQFSSKCQSGKCSVSLAYAEGSRWDAYEAKDVVWLGGDKPEDRLLGGQSLSMPFVFGCQTYETGLFRTQLEDGIMGLSNQELTIVPKLKESSKIQDRVFAMCLTETGGTLRLGGYDTKHLTKPMQFVPFTKTSGWYTIKLVDVKIGDKSIGANMDLFNNGQGTIVDSGTTDTYFPRQVASAFMSTYRSVAPIAYSTDHMDVEKVKMEDLPPVVFVFENGVEASMPASSYLECSDGGTSGCAGSIFLDNGNGAVLGANFMTGREVVFDIERRQVGFADANCEFSSTDDAAAAAAAPSDAPTGDQPAAAAPAPAPAPAATAPKDAENVDCSVTYGQPAGACDAVCPGDKQGVAEGKQQWTTIVSTPQKGTGLPCPELAPRSRPCFVNCTIGNAASPEAAAKKGACENDAVAWTKCSAQCTQEAVGKRLKADGSCEPVTLTRECSTGDVCDRAKRGFLVEFSLLLRGVDSAKLTPEAESTVLDQASYLLQTPAGDLEVARRVPKPEGTSLHLRLHLPTNSTSVYTVGHKVLSPEQKAAEVNATVAAPPFAPALLQSLKQSGAGVFEGLEGVALMSSMVSSYDTGAGPDDTLKRPIKVTVLVWDVIGGSAAVLLLVGLIVHFRWSHWQSLSQQPPSSLFNRIRDGVDSTAPPVGGGGMKGRAPKPNPRSYSRVDSQEMAGEGEGHGNEVEMI